MVDLKEAERIGDISVFSEVSKYEHEQVVFCYDHATGLKAIIGIHNTTLGPALGGTRMWVYNSEAEALNDVLRLSRGMTFKNAIAGLNHGGGKAVIIGDAKKQKSEALLRRFGKFVQSLSGKYITAEDVGMSTRDMELIGMETKFVSGMPDNMGGSGDPSPVTAYSTYMGMKAAAKKAFGTDDLSGKKVSVQGIGHVGGYLVDLLAKEGAQLFITDIYEDRLREVASKHASVKVVGLDEIYDLDVDIYAPCALGATVNDNTLKRLKCQVIAGAANNQLKDETIHGNACRDMGIIYAPDFLINSGGVINVAMELTGYNRENAYAQAAKIYDYTTDILNKADAENINTQHAAMKVARERIESIGRIKMVL
jgi:leucine dehydrogenase